MGKVTNLSAHQVGEARAASGMYGGTFDKISSCSTQEEADAVMKTTNCPLCRLPKGHAKSHHISYCPFIKSMGLNVKYKKEADQRLADYTKKKEQASKVKLEDDKDTVTGASAGLVKKSDSSGYYTAAETKGYNERQVKKKKAREEVETAGTVVGASGEDAVTDKDKDESIKKNPVDQSKTAGSGHHVTGGLSRFAQSKEDQFGFSDVSTSVDAASAVKNVNTSGSLDYFQTVVSNMLSPLDRVTTDGTVRKCISVARCGCHNVKVNMGVARKATNIFNFDHIIPDSGATSHIRQNCMDFEGDFVLCDNVFVLMGDHSEIPVLGYSNSRVKINGHVVRLVDNLHVPDLDVDLFSCTRHGSNGKGNTFFLGEEKMHLTFPQFTVTDDIPENGDLKVPIEPLSESDWAIPNSICDGIPLQDEQ